ncbi:PAS domain S-box-containing protein [Fodinibius sediminis]|uniref:PAS domain S-box-containing protein n=2 Tax=Fodinibius sediminis TaxID=1214077 RepID=A0A521B4L8_9BACT|nr:PAS domain S-box-containing protein [Fodinibius sediminis]
MSGGDMSAEKETVKSVYFKGFHGYVIEGDEKYLYEAYGESRKILEEGITELTMIGLHHEVLAQIFESEHISPSEEIFEKSADYCKEWMAPFEVKLQSYRALVDELNQKNEQLEKEIESRKEIQRELSDSKAYFQSLIENAQDIITVVDYKGVIQFASPSTEHILGYPHQKLIGKNAFQFIHHEDVNKVKHVFYDIRSNGEMARTVVFRFRHNNGEWRYLESIAKNIPSSREGSIIVINSRDITNRRKRMQNLKEHRAKLTEAQQIAKVGSWEWSLHEENRSHMEWSDEMYRIYGMVPGKDKCSYDIFVNHIYPSDRRRVKAVLDAALRNKSTFSIEHRIVRSDNEVRTLLGRGQVLTDENEKITKMIGTVQDITEQKEKEVRLRQYSEQLRKLSERAERTREEERIRIARTIHDELGQMLTVLKMDVSMMSGKVTKKLPEDLTDYYEEQSEKISERIDTIIKSVQRITTELRPEVLDDLGLIEALQWQGREFAKRTGLDIQFKTNINKTDFLREDIATTLYRIFQEAMHNVIRHADATSVKIELQKIQDNLLLMVDDDGVGINRDQMEARSAYGIIGMRERARFLGGDVYIEGKENEGTRVTVRIPMEKE